MRRACHYEDRNCDRCGKTFSPTGPRGRWCSAECKRGEAICVRCGTSFRPTANSSRRYCTKQCWYSDPVRKGVRPKLALRSCSFCGNEFQPRRGSQFFCTRQCGTKSRRNPGAATHCELCGVELVGEYHAERRFCSQKCAAKGRRQGARDRAVPEGTKRVATGGYVQVKTGTTWMHEHRLVLEQALGRKLERWERVHHRNGDRADNSPENLELWKRKSGGHPSGIRHADYHCAGCRCHVQTDKRIIPH